MRILLRHGLMRANVMAKHCVVNAEECGWSVGQMADDKTVRNAAMFVNDNQIRCIVCTACVNLCTSAYTQHSTARMRACVRAYKLLDDVVSSIDLLTVGKNKLELFRELKKTR